MAEREHTNTRTTAKDLTGMRFGRLVVEARDGFIFRDNRPCWKCRCDCGTVRRVNEANLRTEKTRSCGCLQRDAMRSRSTTRSRTHGKTGTLEYNTWHAMKKRCNCPTSVDYPDYGGRGIKVCERWSAFANFLADMGERPTAKHTLDRIDNEGDYTPENCRWATLIEQARNKRNNRLLTHAGEALTLPEWSERTGIETGTLFARLRRGWSAERTLCTPVPKATS